MSKLSEKQFIESIKQLKEIKPREEWAILLKSQILSTKFETNSNFQNNKFSKRVSDFGFRISDFFLGFKIQKRLAYSFATIAFIFVGLIGFAQYTVPGDLLFPVKKITEQSEAVLYGQTVLKQSAAAFNTRINELAQVSKDSRQSNVSLAINEIKSKALELAKNLNENTVEDSATVKEIASSLKTLASITDTENINENEDVRELYKAVVDSQIKDLKEITLTEEQEIILTEIEDLQKQEKYTEALEKILLINN